MGAQPGRSSTPFPILAWFLGRGIIQKTIFSFHNKECSCCLCWVLHCRSRKCCFGGGLKPRKRLVHSSIPRTTAGGTRLPACPPSLSLGLYLPGCVLGFLLLLWVGKQLGGRVWSLPEGLPPWGCTEAVEGRLKSRG